MNTWFKTKIKGKGSHGTWEMWSQPHAIYQTIQSGYMWNTNWRTKKRLLDCIIGANEMALLVKVPLHKLNNLSSIPRVHIESLLWRHAPVIPKCLGCVLYSQWKHFQSYNSASLSNSVPGSSWGEQEHLQVYTGSRTVGPWHMQSSFSK